jgi:hypothetical protein
MTRVQENVDCLRQEIMAALTDITKHHTSTLTSMTLMQQELADLRALVLAQTSSSITAPNVTLPDVVTEQINSTFTLLQGVSSVTDDMYGRLPNYEQQSKNAEVLLHRHLEDLQAHHDVTMTSIRDQNLYYFSQSLRLLQSVYKLVQSNHMEVKNQLDRLEEVNPIINIPGIDTALIASSQIHDPTCRVEELPSPHADSEIVPPSMSAYDHLWS